MTSVVELAEHLARPARVLVLEGDDNDATRILVEALSAYDFELVTASGVNDAAREVSTKPFDIVFIDLRPDALEVVRELKRFSPKTAIVILTGAESEQTLDRILRWGMVAMLRRPTSTAVHQIRETLDLFKIKTRAKPATCVAALA